MYPRIGSKLNPDLGMVPNEDAYGYVVMRTRNFTRHIVGYTLSHQRAPLTIWHLEDLMDETCDNRERGCFPSMYPRVGSKIKPDLGNGS